CSKIFLGKSYTRSQRDLSTNDTVSTQHAMFFGEEVHRTAFTFGASCSLTKNLSHTGISRHAFSQRLRVITIRGDEGILFASDRNSSRYYSFFAIVQVEDTTNRSLTVQYAGLLIGSART